MRQVQQDLALWEKKWRKGIEPTIRPDKTGKGREGSKSRSTEDFESNKDVEEGGLS